MSAHLRNLLVGFVAVGTVAVACNKTKTDAEFAGPRLGESTASPPANPNVPPPDAPGAVGVTAAISGQPASGGAMSGGAARGFNGAPAAGGQVGGANNTSVGPAGNPAGNASAGTSSGGPDNATANGEPQAPATGTTLPQDRTQTLPQDGDQTLPQDDTGSPPAPRQPGVFSPPPGQ